MSEQICSGDLLANAEAFAGQEHGLLIAGRWQPAAPGQRLDTAKPVMTAL